jgi:1-phosphofructokinase
MRTTIITVTLNPAIDRVIEVENFTLGAHQVGREVLRSPGGKAVNISRILSALGVPTVATGFLGADNRKEFAPLLADMSVRAEFFTVPGRTRENVTIADPATGQETHVRDVGLTVSPRDVARLSSKLSLLSRAGGIVIFSGSLPPSMAPEVFGQLVETCMKAKARVAVDTSGPALREIGGRPLWLAKPNAAELPDLAGRELPDLKDQLTAARRLTWHIDNVLFSRGAEGAYLFTQELALFGRAPLEAGRVRNTVGCGDALLGAFVGAVFKGLPPRQAFAEAVACSTATACTLMPAELDVQVLEELRPLVEIQDI